MKITAIEQFKVAVPYIEGIQKYRPTEHTELPILIIKMHTDEGIVGLGDGGRGMDVSAEIDQWIGVDPRTVDISGTYAPFSHALYDILGKATGLPAHRFMGSKRRDQVPVGYWSCHMEPEDTAREAARGHSLGFKTHKLKARPWDIVRTVQLMSEAAGPDYAIIVDPNFYFETLPDSLRLARQLEQYNIFCFEDPFRFDDWSQYRLFRQKSSIALAAHLHTPLQVLEAVRHEAADYFNLGGANFDITYRCAAIAAAAQRRVWLQEEKDLSLGVAAAYAAHVACVIPNAEIPLDILHFLRENDLVHNALPPNNGTIAVPSGPGLGVELDEEAIAHYRVG
jgi:L-alanine-DL-glutamate epimerase-like enolase superfamily enzyme